MGKNRETKGRKGYHHGNLREALVSAVLGLIADKGPNGFTFSEAARAAGVSPAAPYRHFKDRDALLDEVAKAGFELFADRLERAYDKGGPSPVRAFEAVTAEYLDFARRERSYFIAMFHSDAPESPDAPRAGERAFGVLRRACEGLVRHLPAQDRPPIHMMTYHIWSMCHGIAELFGREDTQRRSPIAAAELLEAGTAIYLRGLGILPDR